MNETTLMIATIAGFILLGFCAKKFLEWQDDMKVRDLVLSGLSFVAAIVLINGSLLVTISNQL